MILVLAIISGYIASRSASVAGFDERLASEQLLTLARSAQQLSFSRPSVDIFVQDLGLEYRVAVRIDGSEEVARTFPKSEVQLTADMSAAGGSAGVCSAISSPITISYNSSGELSNAYSAGTYEDGFPICLNGNTPDLCISPAGFAHLGSCV